MVLVVAAVLVEMGCYSDVRGFERSTSLVIDRSMLRACPLAESFSAGSSDASNKNIRFDGFYSRQRFPSRTGINSEGHRYAPDDGFAAADPNKQSAYKSLCQT